jgi:membrane-associated phospholipid phosphatase
VWRSGASAGGRGGPGGVLKVPPALSRVDEALMRRAARRRSPALDRALVTASGTANYSRLWLLIAGALALLGGRRGRAAASRGLAAVAIASAVANGPVKWLVSRQRPGAGSEATLVPMPRSSSFPSGHSASAFAFASATGSELPVLRPLLVPLAAAVAYSRVHAGVHYPSDVAAGATVGVLCGALARRLPWPSKD